MEFVKQHQVLHFVLLVLWARYAYTVMAVLHAVMFTFYSNFFCQKTKAQVRTFREERKDTKMRTSLQTGKQHNNCFVSIILLS